MTLVIVVCSLLVLGFMQGCLGWVLRKLLPYDMLPSDMQICYFNDMKWLVGKMSVITMFVTAMLTIVLLGKTWEGVVAIAWMSYPLYESIKELVNADDYVRQVLHETELYWNRPNMWTV